MRPPQTARSLPATVRERVTPGGALLVGLIATQIAYGRGSPPRPPSATRRVLAMMLASSTAEAWEARGPLRGGGVLAAAGTIGFAAEVIGVATGWPFGRYQYSDKLGSRIGGVPLLAAGAWATMARPAWVTAGWLSSRAVLRVPLAALALTAWDVYLDPRMAAEGYWSWRDGGRYQGVPAANFGGWMATGMCAFGVIAGLDRSAPTRDDDGALALYVWTWIAEGVANVMFWRRPVSAVAGAITMGTFAAPALVRRNRA